VARDGLIIVAAGNPRLWIQLCEAIGAEHLTTDSRFVTNTDRLKNRRELKDALEALFQQLPLDELIERLQAHNVPCGRVRSVAEALADPQLLARDMIVTIAHPELGEIKNLGNPIKLSRTPYVIKLPPPRLGEHTDEVLCDLRAEAERP
jgi:crotonobetainyl-CoA:carnitine CoA-transferase CaiB-like acyl-CoA transferase